MDEKRNQTKVFDQKDFNPKRSTFDLSYPNKMTLNFNKIYPILAKATLPGDSWTIKTDIFSRWLAMQAPTFSEYSLKFMSAFVANNMIYGGWQQFIGLGDDQSAQYLLPAENNDLTSRELPYFTTRDLSKFFFRKWFLPYMDEGILQIQNFAQKYLRLFIVPLLCHPAKATNSMLETSSYDDEVCFDYTEFHVVPTWIVGSRRDDAFWDEMVSNHYAFEVTEYNLVDHPEKGIEFHAWETDSVGGGLRHFPWCFHCHGANLEMVANKIDDYEESPAFIELPKDVFFPNNVIDYRIVSGKAKPSQLTQAQAELFQVTRYFPHVLPISSNNSGYMSLLSGDNPNGYIPYGYIYDLLPSELYTNADVHTTISYLQVFERTIGQHIVCQMMGDGTLSDCLNKNKEQHLLRQPFDVANRILGNVILVRHSYNPHQHPVVSSETPRGTYNEKSEKYSVGIINDVPISFLPYLAYHKIWTDRLRDNRYELRCIYSDPYKSPFMIPLKNNGSNATNGLYVSGNLFAQNSYGDEENVGYYPSYLALEDVFNMMSWKEYSHDHDYELTPEKPFSIQSFDMLLSLRERRVVHDFFTMVTPTSQFGDEAVANVADDAVSTLTLRLATRLQKFLERSNFVGSDFVKQTLAHFGVKPSHCNHCSVKYLGGKVMKPIVSPVTITSTDNDSTDQVTGQQSAQMYCSGNLGKVRFECNEHGYVFQLATIQNDFFTVDGEMVDPIKYFDYPLPEFADLGPEPLPLQRVVQTDGTPTVEGTQNHPLSVFGYIPRYGQWKCSLAEIHGDFRKSLSYWVTKRLLDPDLFNGSFGYGKRGNIPQIGENFLYENPNYDAFVYDGEEFDHALFDINHMVTCSRLLPKLPSPNVL